MKKIIIISLLFSFLNAGLFPQNKEFSNTIVDRGKIRRIVEKMPEGLKEEEVYNSCKEKLEEKKYNTNMVWLLSCQQDYEMYYVDPFSFIKKFVDNIMSVREDSYELTPTKEQKLSCDDMLIGLNKGTLERLFPRFDGEDLEDFALNYCIENYSDGYFN